MSKPANSARPATSATRSVPARWPSCVSTARTPARSTTWAIIGESVATTSSLDQTVLHDALNHPGDERLTGQQLERFVGETGRAKTSRNDTEDAHHER